MVPLACDSTAPPPLHSPVQRTYYLSSLARPRRHMRHTPYIEDTIIVLVSLIVEHIVRHNFASFAITCLIELAVPALCLCLFLPLRLPGQVIMPRLEGLLQFEYCTPTTQSKFGSDLFAFSVEFRLFQCLQEFARPPQPTSKQAFSKFDFSVKRVTAHTGTLER